MSSRYCLTGRVLETIVLVSNFLLMTAAAQGQVDSTFRSDKLSLSGAWKFQLRHDNQLTANGAVQFGPLSASSQAYLNAQPWPPDVSGGWKMVVPWGLSATLLGSPTNSAYGGEIWKPHPEQRGPTWWQADLGSKQTVAMVRIHWVIPAKVSVSVEISDGGVQWTPWTRGESGPEEPETTLSGPPSPARFVKLLFLPQQFQGTRRIEVYLRDSDGERVLWQPPVRKAWYEELRKYTPPDGFQLPAYQDSQWGSIQVPGYWETQGFGESTWFQPNDEVGYYRRTFIAPAAWQDRRVRLRFEGANSGAQVWVNGSEVGYHESGFTAFEYDVTPLLHFGAENLIAVRVSKWTLTDEYDTDDAYFLGGLWRDVYLYSLPADRIEDFWVRTELDPVYRNAVLRVELKLQAADPTRVRECVVEGSLYDGEGKEVPRPGLRAEMTLTGRDPLPVELASVVNNPRKWTAETPYLYTLVVRLKVDGKVVQEFKSPVGFRQVEVVGSSIRLNGVPIGIRGVVTTRANPNDAGESWEKIFAREIRLLKEGNINAIRSHTTPLEEEFLSLCDRYGIYVMPDVPYVWVHEDDFRYLTDGIVQRAREVFEQHKNHPCVILWHIGNENPPTTAYLGGGRAARWLHETDPTRPVAVCRNLVDFEELGTEFSDLHYDPMSSVEFREIFPAPVLFGEFHAVPNEISRLQDRGFVETWGRSLEREWSAFLDRSWYVVGGLICCWDDGSVRGNLGSNQWGVLDSKRQAKPVHYYIRKAYAPVRLALLNASFSGGRLNATLRVTNLYNFINLDGFRFKWELRKDGRAVASGEEAYQVEPKTSFSFPLSLKAMAGPERLRFAVYDSAGYSIQDEEFPLPVASPSAKIGDLLSKAGVRETPAISLKPGAHKIQTTSYSAAWGANSLIRIQDRNGRDLVTLNGLAMQSEKTYWTNLRVEPIQYQPVRTQRGSVSIPFSIPGGTKDKKESWQLAGTLDTQFGESWIRVSYVLEPTEALAIPEAGIRLRLGEQFAHLSWNRDALCTVSPEGWAASSLEQHILLKVLRETVSKRNLFWANLESDRSTVLLVPLGSSTNLRIGDAADEIVLSDFLAAGDFLGKFDKETAEKKLAPGEKFQGGFTMYFLSEGQRAKFTQLSAADKDLTWMPRLKLDAPN